MRGTVAKQLRRLAKDWKKNDFRVTNFRVAYQTLKERYKKAKGSVV